MAMSSAPQVRHGTFFSGGGGLAARKLENTPDSLRLEGDVVVADLARLTCVLAAVVVELRFSGGRTDSMVTVDLLRRGAVGSSRTITLRVTSALYLDSVHLDLPLFIVAWTGRSDRCSVSSLGRLSAFGCLLHFRLFRCCLGRNRDPGLAFRCFLSSLLLTLFNGLSIDILAFAV